MLRYETVLADVECGKAVVPRLCAVKHFSDVPQLVLPEVEHDFQATDAFDCPSDLDGHVFVVFGDFEDFKLHVCI